jgi:hypothetical protein
MNIRKTILAAITLALPLAILAAQDLEPKTPRKLYADEVVVVVCVKVNPVPDMEFFSAYNTPTKTGQAFVPYIELKASGILSDRRSDLDPYDSMPMYFKKGALGKMTSFMFQVDGYREIKLTAFRATLSDCGDLYIVLPVGAKAVVPLDVSYIYIGTLTFKRSDDYFTIESIDRGDDFDDAKVYVRETYGAAAADALVRAPLQAIKPED